MKEGIITISCPAENCAFILEYDEIRELCGPKIFAKLHPPVEMLINRYDELITRKAYEDDPNFRWCTNFACSTGQIVENGGI